MATEPKHTSQPKRRKSLTEEVLEEFAEHSSSALTLEMWVEHRVSAKRQRDRDREDQRRGRRHRVTAFKKARGGFLVEKTPAPEKRWVEPTTDDREMLARLQKLIEAAQPLDPDRFAWINEDTAERMRKRRGLVPEGILSLIRAAHGAAFPTAGEPHWHASLRGWVDYALRYRLAGGKPKLLNVDVLTGKGIVARVMAKSPPGSVPDTLTAGLVDKLLRSTTLGRGGRGKRNIVVALDELIERLEAGQTRSR